MGGTFAEGSEEGLGEGYVTEGVAVSRRMVVMKSSTIVVVARVCNGFGRLVLYRMVEYGVKSRGLAASWRSCRTGVLHARIPGQEGHDGLMGFFGVRGSEACI